MILANYQSLYILYHFILSDLLTKLWDIYAYYKYTDLYTSVLTIQIQRILYISINHKSTVCVAYLKFIFSSLFCHAILVFIVAFKKIGNSQFREFPNVDLKGNSPSARRKANLNILEITEGPPFT